MSDHLCVEENSCTRWDCMIRDIRVERGWTRDQLHAASGVSASTICRLEQGEGGNVGTIEALLAALDHELDVFAADSGAPYARAG